MKHILLLLIAGIIFSGCATKVSQKGLKTREIDISWKNSCVFISSGETSSYTKFGAQNNYDTVRNNIQNITATNGSNAYILNSIKGDGMGHYTGKFEMYKCPETKYHLPKKFESLEKLKELLDKGVITQDEYNTEKTKVLNSY